jgi:DNA-binding CsgD family transcriptional regulator
MTDKANARHSTDPFVGRQRELASLANRLDTARRGEAGVVLISGEPGIGKSRLLQEAAEQAEQEGWRVLLGRAYDSEGMPPYLPFIEALQDYVRLCPVEELQPQLGHGAAQVALILPEVGRRLPDLQPRPRIDAETARYALYESVSDFLEAIARASKAGLLLCLDDLQWADHSTLLLVEHLLRHLAGVPFLIVATYRDTDLAVARPLARTLEQLTRQRVSQRLDVKRLSLDEVGFMLAAIGRPGPPLPLVKAVYDETEGNPFFIREVFEYLAGAGLLFDQSGAWRTDLHIGEIDVPQSVLLAIGRRLDRLSEEGRRLLVVASVLGRTFDYDLLRNLAGLEDEALLGALEEAEAAQLLASDDNARLTFAHELIRQTLIGGQTALRRQRLHLRAAQAFEAVHGDALESHFAELAGHYRAAGAAANPEATIDYSERAAEADIAVYAWEEAASHYQWALQALEASGRQDHSRHCDLLLAQGKALVAAGEQDRILNEVAPAALALAQEIGDKARAFTACRIAIDSTPPHLPSWLDTAQGCVGDDPEDRVALNLSLLVQMFHEGRFSDLKALLHETLALARESGKPDLVLTSAGPLLRSGVLSAEEESHLFDELMTHPRAGMSTRNLSELQFNAITTYLQWGERSEAEAERRELAELAVQTHDHQAVLNSAAAEVVFDTLDGRLSEAMKPSLWAGTYPRAWQGRLAGWLGDAAALETDLAWSERFSSPSSLGPGFKAFFLAYLGRLDQAGEVIAEMLPGLAARPPAQAASSYWLRTLLLEAAALIGDKTAARMLFDLNCGDERRLAKPLLVLLPRHLAGAAALLGDYDRAKAGYAEAIDFCQRIGYRPELALSRLDLAQLLLKHYPGERGTAFAHLDFAIAEFEAMDMLPPLKRAMLLRGRRRRESAAKDPAYPDHLSEREVEVLRLIAAGKSNQEIADELVISLNTAMHHVASIFNKTSVSNRAEATSYAHRHALI